MTMETRFFGKKDCASTAMLSNKKVMNKITNINTHTHIYTQFTWLMGEISEAKSN